MIKRSLIFAILVVTACDRSSPTEPKSAFELSPTAPSLLVGSSIRLSLRDAQRASTQSAVKWSSSDPSIVAIDALGRISGKSPGTATIRAYIDNTVVETRVTAVATTNSLRTAVSTTCGITSADALYCWGANFVGQVGIGSTTSPITTPQKVAGGLSFSSVSMGEEHTCGLVAGAAYCWGYAGTGQLGDGNKFTVVSSPTKVLGGQTFVKLEANGTGTRKTAAECSDEVCAGQTCGLDASGSLLCWGSGSLTPAKVDLDQRFVWLSLGYNYACAIDVASVGYCWGGSSYGQSSGSVPNGRDLKPVPSLFFQRLSAGSDHTCGLTLDGDIYCWGANTTGQLGAPSDAQCITRFATSPCRSTPAKVQTDLKFVSVSVGTSTPFITDLPATSHTCAITTDLAAVCWGANDYGQLGNGNTQQSQSPVAVSGGLKFRSVTAGRIHTCGVTTEGAGYCWGYNVSGELGNGGTTSSSVPAAIAGGLVFK